MGQTSSGTNIKCYLHWVGKTSSGKNIKWNKQQMEPSGTNNANGWEWDEH